MVYEICAMRECSDVQLLKGLSRNCSSVEHVSVLCILPARTEVKLVEDSFGGFMKGHVTLRQGLKKLRMKNEQ